MEDFTLELVMRNTDVVEIRGTDGYPHVLAHLDMFWPRPGTPASQAGKVGMEVYSALWEAGKATEDDQLEDKVVVIGIYLVGVRPREEMEG